MNARKSGIIPNSWACENCGLPFYDEETAEKCCKSGATTIKRTSELRVGDLVRLFNDKYGDGTVVKQDKYMDTVTIRRPFIFYTNCPNVGWEDVTFGRNDSYKHKVYKSV